MPQHYRPKEAWMQKGTTVKTSNGSATLLSFTEATMDDQQVILSVVLQPAGTKHSFPFNPWDIDEMLATKGFINQK